MLVDMQIIAPEEEKYIKKYIQLGKDIIMLKPLNPFLKQSISGLAQSFL